MKNKCRICRYYNNVSTDNCRCKLIPNYQKLDYSTKENRKIINKNNETINYKGVELNERISRT